MQSKPFLCGLLLSLFATTFGWGFTFISNNRTGLPIKWPAGNVPFVVALGTSTTLSDGNTHNTSAQQAMNIWNAQLGSFQFQAQSVAPRSAGNGNDINELVFSNTVFGTAFDSNVLAVATTWASGNDRTEADIIFNTARTWDSYRGPTRGSTIDLQRVAIHELGHALGLDHPDEATPAQSVSAVMNSRVGNLDTISADDIAGARQLYGPPGIPSNDNFASASVLSLDSGALQATGFNTNATKQSGEPLHANNTGGRSVWWRWTAPASGPVSLNTQGSVFDTTLGVYTGNAVSALTVVAFDDDLEDGVIQYSSLSFTATNGTTYSFAVDGFDADSAAITLNLTFTPDQTVTTGHSITFFAGTGDTFQWQISTNGGASWSNLANNTTYSGATTATLTIANADSSLNGARFRVLTTTGSVTSTSTGFILTVAPALIPNPTGLVVDTSGTLIVADASLNTLQKVSPAGVVSAFVGTSGQAGSTDATGTAARFNQPSGLARASSGVIHLSDTGNATIRRIATDGTVTTFAGSPGSRGNVDGTSATFSSPVGLAIDASGNLYVADKMNHTIRLITTTGTVSTYAGAAGVSGTTNGTGASTTARFNNPSGVALDTAGNLYIADTFNHTIRKITPPGLATTFAGVGLSSGTTDGTGSAALFNNPTGLALDSAGNLYVADTANSTIRKITPAGVVTTFAGLPTISGLKDGTGNDAWFNQPQALAFDSTGNLYVADTGNAAIRKITPARVVTTLSLNDGTTPGTPVTPSTPATPTPAPASGGGGGGGGSPSYLFLSALTLLSLLRIRGRARCP